MGLTRTISLETAGSLTDAATHRELLLALDELLEARFNERSWLAFTSDPQLPTGDVFIFGTPDNLQMAGSAYDPADETESAPSGGQVLDYDAATKVVWVDGSYSDAPTLNRRTVEWQSPEEASPSTWWLGFIRAERWLPLGLADLVVEDYTDAVASVNTTFTWRSHWDRYGCIRIHNGNRFALTLAFEDASQPDVEIPPYGIVCGRRPAHDEPFVFESTYLPLTAANDPAKWEPQHDGQSAASMSVAIGVFDDLREFCRIKNQIDTDSTSRERGSFTGETLAGTDYVQDWLIHRGDLLSVVLDKRDGTITTQTMTWNGVGSVPDAGWTGHVSVTLIPNFIQFESDATAPSGAASDEWEHDLIPVSTNVTNGAILALHAGAVNVAPQDQGSTPWWSMYRELGEFSASSVTFYPPFSGEPSYSFPRIQHSVTGQGVNSDVELVIEDEFVSPTPLSGTTVEADAVVKNNSALIHYQRVALALANWGMTELQDTLLTSVDTDTISSPTWEEATGVPNSDLRRFTARQVRKYHTAGELDGGSAVYHYHPQDTDVDGTTDGLGGALGWAVQPVLSSQVRIQGTPWTQEATTKGRDVYTPADVLHTVLENIETANWWLDNRTAMLAGTLAESDKLLTWRVPRLVEQFNDLARAINNVREVTPVTIYDLYKDPLPAPVGSEDYERFPFYYSGEVPFAVPADWVEGRYDSSDVLQDWADLWSITLETGVPDVATLRAVVRTIVYAAYDGPSSNETTNLLLGDAENNSAIAYSEATVNGETYNTWSAWSAAAQLTLFGGRGTDSGYKWLSATEAHSVFDALGVAIPVIPCGELYNPALEAPTAITQTEGDPRPGGSTENFEADVVTAYRMSDADGTWIRVVNAADTPFRLIDVDSERVRQFFIGADLTWELTETADSLDYISHPFVIGGAASSSSWVETPVRLTPRSGSFDGVEAWPTLRRFDADYPCLLVAAPEPHWELDYDDTGETWTPHDPDLEEGLFFRECTAADMPLTVAKLKDWASIDWDCWHCQVVPRTGVLREL